MRGSISSAAMQMAISASPSPYRCEERLSIPTKADLFCARIINHLSQDLSDAAQKVATLVDLHRVASSLISFEAE